MDSDAEDLLKILHESYMVEEASARLPIDKEIDITPVCGFATRHGTEHFDIAGAVQRGDTQDFFPFSLPERFECNHVLIVRHASLS
jgi:hypothetical protein